MSKEFTDINKLLKFDPSNVVGLTQKKENLAKAIEACAEKLRILEQAQEQVTEQFKQGKVSEEHVNALKREIELTSAKMSGFQKQLNGTYVALNNLGDESADVVKATKAMAEASEEAKTEAQKLAEGFADVNTKSKDLSKELAEIDKMLKSNADNTALLAQKKAVLYEAVDTCAKKLELLEQAEREVQEQFARGEASEAQVRELQREIIATESAMDNYKGEVLEVVSALTRLEVHSIAASDEVDELGDEADEAANEVDDLGDEADEADGKVSGLKNAAEKASGGFTVLKGVVSDLISECLQELVELLKEASKYMLQTGMDFEAGMSRVEAISGASAEEMDKLTDKAIEMGAKTKFSAGESAEAFGYLAQAGWDTEMMLDGIDGVMNLAASDGLDLATASNIVADALTSMGYEAKDASKFADVLAMAAAKSNTNVSMMGESFKYVGPLAGALGYEMEDVGTALGLMANSGIKAEQAGTSLRSLLTNLSKPSDACAEAMERYGISLTDANGQIKPLDQMMFELRNTFKGLSEAEKVALASTLANKTGMSGLLAIVNASDKEFSEMGLAMLDADGAAQKMAETMQDNLAGDVEKLGGAFDTLAINITDKFNGSLRDGVQAITAFLDGEATLTETLGALSGALTQAFGVFRSYLPQLAQMGRELITYLVNGLVTGLPVLLSKANELVANFCSYIAAAAPQLVSIAGSLLTSFVQGIFEFIPTLITGAAEIVGSLANGITENAASFVSTGLGLLEQFADNLTVALPQLIENGMAFIKNLVVGLMQALPDFINRAPEIISKFANLINDNFPTILAKGVGIIWELIKGIIKAIPTLVKNIPKIISAIVDVWEAFNWLQLGKQALQAIGNGIKSLWGWIKGIGKSTLEAITSFLKTLPQNLLNLGKKAMTSLGSGLSSLLGSIIQTAKNIGTSIINAFTGLPGKMVEIGRNLISGLWDGIKNVGGWLWDKISGFGGTVVGWFKDIFGIKSPSRVMAEIGGYLDEGLAEGLLDNMSSPVKAVREVANGVLGEAQDMDGLSIERNLQQRAMQSALSVTTIADNAMLAKLDQLLTAIKAGQVITLDGKQLVGGTASAYDNVLGQRRMLAARGAL